MKQDWALLRTTQASLREHMELVKQLKEEIAGFQRDYSLLLGEYDALLSRVQFLEKRLKELTDA